MKETDGIMEREDYTDPQCPFCTDAYKDEPPVKSVPVGRIIDKADEYFSRNDYGGAEKHFLYWLKEAEEGGDDRGAFTILNELMGLYRKIGEKRKALDAVAGTLDLVDKIGISEETAAGTAYVNAGTVYKSFGMATEALPLFGKAAAIYEKNLKGDDGRLGGLYNNMALALTDAGRFDEARKNYLKAMDVMKNVRFGELETAVTCLNLANLVEAERGLEDGAAEIADLVEKAYALLDAPGIPKNGYYAFVCEKCAPSFGYYGYFVYENDLKNRAKEIYERS